MKRIVAWYCEHLAADDFTHPTSRPDRSRVGSHISSKPTGCPNAVPLVQAGRFTRRQLAHNHAAETESASAVGDAE